MTKKIEEKLTVCENEDHRPTEDELKGVDLEPGKYLHVCPNCGKKVYWTVEE